MERSNIGLALLRGAVLAAGLAALTACGGGGGGGDNPPVADAQPDKFSFDPPTFKDVAPGSSVEASTRVSGFEGTLKATFKTEGPVSATLQIGKDGNPAKSVDIQSGDTVIATITVNEDAKAGETFTLTMTVGSGDFAISGSLKGTVGDTEAPKLAVTFPASTSISVQPTISVSGQVTDNNEIALVEINGSTSTGTVDADGFWTVADVPLEPGANQLSVRAVDAAGNISTHSLSVFYDNLWFESPVAVHAIGQSRERVLVLDDVTDTLYEVNFNSGERKVISGPDTANTEGAPMRFPVDMTVNESASKAYVLNNGPDVNGVIEVDLATGAREVVTSTFSVSTPPSGGIVKGGTHPLWTHPYRIARKGNSTLYVTDGAKFYEVSITTGARTLKWAAPAVIRDIEVGTFKNSSGVSFSNRVLLLTDDNKLRLVTTTSIASMDYEVDCDCERVVVSDDRTFASLEYTAGGTIARQRDPMTGLSHTSPYVTRPKAVLGDALAATVFTSGFAYKYGFAFPGRVADAFHNEEPVEFKPAELPALGSGPTLRDIFGNGSPLITRDGTTGKLYFAQGSGATFKLFEFDPATGVRKLLLENLSLPRVQLTATPNSFAARDDKIYFVTHGPTGSELDGLYVVDAKNCMGSDDDSCVSPLLVNGPDRVTDNREIFDGEVRGVFVDADHVWVMNFGSYIDESGTKWDGAMKIRRSDGAIEGQRLIEKQVEAEAVALLGGEIYLDTDDGSHVRISKFNIGASSETPSETIVSRCSSTDIFSLTCEESAEKIGTGPSLLSAAYLAPLGSHALLGLVATSTPDPLAGTAMYGYGLYRIDLEDGDRVFLSGTHPADGNKQFSSFGDPGLDKLYAMDTAGRRLYKFTWKPEQNEIWMVNMASGANGLPLMEGVLISN